MYCLKKARNQSKVYFFLYSYYSSYILKVQRSVGGTLTLTC